MGAMKRTVPALSGTAVLAGLNPVLQPMMRKN